MRMVSRHSSFRRKLGYGLTVLLLSWVCVAQAQETHESFSSKLYFPGAIGLNLPFGNPQESLKNGIMLSTAVEFRPKSGNALFIRFNYDALSNHYQQVLSNSPTNVNTGKLSSAVFSLGIGYRRQTGPVRIFGLLQPGIATNHYDKVMDNGGVITINQVSKTHASIKITGGVEYYLAEHFALVAEPSYFYLSPSGGYKLLNPQSFNFSIGFTTTLF